MRDFRTDNTVERRVIVGSAPMPALDMRKTHITRAKTQIVAPTCSIGCNAVVFERAEELNELHNRVHDRKPFLIYGESGAGKTFLVQNAISGLRRVLYCANSTTGQCVFRSLATELFRVKEQLIRRSCGRSGEQAIKSKSILSLRGLVLNALRDGEYWVVLDHMDRTSASLASDVRDMMLWSNTPVMAVARSNHMEHLGFLTSFFALRSEQMHIRPFRHEVAREFAECVAQQVGLQAVNRVELLKKIVELSNGLPGCIVALIHMALKSKYRRGEYVMVSSLYIDFRLAWHAANAF